MKKRMISLAGLVCFLLYILWGLKYEREAEEVSSYKIDSMYLCTMDGIYPVTEIYTVDNGEAILQNTDMQSFTDKAVVGEEFIPGAYLQTRIDSAEDFREDSDRLCRNYACEPTLLSAVSLTDATDNFTLYLLGRGVMVETPGSVYCETFREHFDTVSVEGGVRFCFEGQFVGPVDTIGEDYEIENYEYDVGDQIDFSYEQDVIRMTAEIDGFSAGSMSGLHAYPGHSLSADVEYLGSGKWRLEDIGYRN